MLVDGYNIINAWPELENLSRDTLETARIKLLDTLSEFVPWLWEKIIIVYDAYKVKGKSTVHHEKKNIEVIFTGEGQTADSYIERMVVRLLAAGEDVEVASSDYHEQNLVIWKGGRRLSARELREFLWNCKVELKNKFNLPPPRDLLDDRLPEEMKILLDSWRRLR